MPRQRIDQMGGVGLNTDLSPTSLPLNAWTDLFNVVCEDGKLRSVRGERRLFDLDVRPKYQTGFVGINGDSYIAVSDGVRVWTYPTATGIGVDTTVDLGDLSGGPITFTSLNGVLIVNSQTDGPFYLDEAAMRLLALPGWEASWRCRAMVAFKYNLFALGMVEGAAPFPHKVRWSSSAEDGSVPSQWIPAVSNDAGSDVLGETDGLIVGGTVVRDSLFVVKTDSVFSGDWVGGQFVFQFSRLKGGVGTPLERGFAEMRRTLLTFTSADFHAFDGQNLQSLVSQRIRRGIFSKVSQEQFEASQVFVHYPTSRVFLCLPTSADDYVTDAYIYDWEDNTWGHKSLGRCLGLSASLVRFQSSLDLTWDGLENPVQLNEIEPLWVPGGTWDEQIDGTWNQGVYAPSVEDVLLFMESADGASWWLSVFGPRWTNDDGTSKTCRAVRVGVPIEGADGLAMITEAWPEMEGTGYSGTPITVTFRFGGQSAPNAAPIWQDSAEVQTFIPGESYVLTPRVTGRFLCLEVTSNTDGEWMLPSLTFHWERAGER